MTQDINSEYFEWMCSLVRDSKPLKNVSYRDLLWYLHSTEFVYIIPMDANRSSDGIDLRYRFGHDNHYEDPVIASCLDVNPCSMLEMMVALAFRCEEHIMYDPNKGDMAGRWFWMFIKNLGLGDMCDSRFDESQANSVIWRFLNHDYSPDGKGGLVWIPGCSYDLRSMEIWYQMQRYLSEYRRNRMEQ